MRVKLDRLESVGSLAPPAKFAGSQPAAKCFASCERRSHFCVSTREMMAKGEFSGPDGGSKGLPTHILTGFVD